MKVRGVSGNGAGVGNVGGGKVRRNGVLFCYPSEKKSKTEKPHKSFDQVTNQGEIAQQLK